VRTLPHGRCAAVAALIAALGVAAAPVQAAPSRPAEVGRVLRALHAGPTRTRVVVTLRSPSLVAFARSQRSLQGFGSARRVLAGALGSRAYLGELSSYQADEAALIERRVPGVRIGWRYRTVLDGLSVSLRRGQLARLAATPGVERVYPDLTYHALTDTVPAVVDAVPLWGPSLAGAGTGMKIGIIDDGIDQTNPFLSGAGFTPPPGFPLGDRRYTTGKVIVARAFPPPGASAASRLPFDPKVSEHGTHVSGIAAGSGTSDPRPRLVWFRSFRGQKSVLASIRSSSLIQALR
jgi:minor extracellular serine protease Vpr